MSVQLNVKRDVKKHVSDVHEEDVVGAQGVVKDAQDVAKNDVDKVQSEDVCVEF